MKRLLALAALLISISSQLPAQSPLLTNTCGSCHPAFPFVGFSPKYTSLTAMLEANRTADWTGIVDRMIDSAGMSAANRNASIADLNANWGTLSSLSIRGPVSLSSGAVGTLYNPVQFTATGGRGGYTWTQTGLPNGLALSSSGMLSGTPAVGTQNTYSVQITVKDSINATAQAALVLTILPTASSLITITSPNVLSPGTVGVTYTAVRFFAAGGSGAYTWSATGLPAGLTINADGVFGGTPAPGTQNTYNPVFTVQSGGSSQQITLTLIVTGTNPSLGIISPSSLTTGKAGVVYSPVQFAATGGTGTYTWSASGLPNGLTLNAAGLLSGIPAPGSQGSYTTQVTVQDTNGSRAQVTLTWLIQSAGTLSMVVSPGSLSFTGRVGASLPQQSISVFSNTDTVTFSTAASGGSWLSVTAGGSTPAVVNISVNTGGLDAGTYDGVITFTGLGTSPATVQVPVTLVLEADGLPTMSLSPARVEFSAAQGSGMQLKSFSVRNVGGGSLAYSVFGVSNTCITATGSGVATPASPGLVTVRMHAGAAGTCSGGVILQDGSGTSQTVPVTMVVIPGSHALELTRTAVEFSAIAGDTPPVSQTFGVLNTGTGAMDFTVKVSPGAPWLSVGTGFGTATADAGAVSSNVQVNPQGLVAGTYYGFIEVAEGGAVTGIQGVTVRLKIYAAGTAPPPQATPGGLFLYAQQDAASPEASAVTLRNNSSAALTYSATAESQEVVNWLRIGGTGAATGTIPPNGTTNLTISAATNALSTGLYRGKVRVAFGDGTITTVAVALLIPAFSVGWTDAANASRAADGTACSTGSDQLAAVIQTPQDGFLLPAQQFVEVKVLVVDCLAKPVTTATGDILLHVPNSPDAAVSLRHIGDGIYSGVITPVAPAARVELEARLLKWASLDSAAVSLASYRIAGAITDAANGLPPAVQTVFNAAAASQPGQATPGGWVAIKGIGFAEEPVLSVDPYPTSVLGLQVLLGGQALPLYYVSSNQVNALLPASAPTGEQQLTIVRNGVRFAGMDILVMPLQPGLFSQDATGSGLGSILASNTRVPGPAPSYTPASRGETISIYSTGLGPVDGTFPAAGTATPLTLPLLRTTNPVTVTIGGFDARVDFAGLTPGLVGVYQVNAVVPNGVAFGNDVPVIVKVGGQTSNTVTIAVQ